MPPRLAAWVSDELAVEAVHVRGLGLVRARDREIFEAAREADVTIMTKDSDFVNLLGRLGPPPNVLWIRFGNTSNENLRRVLGRTLGEALKQIQRGEALVEITER